MNEIENKISPEEMVGESPQAGAVYRVEGGDAVASSESEVTIEHELGDPDKLKIDPETIYPSNREKIEALSGKAREVLGSLWGKVSESTGIDRAFARMEIAYDQIWVDQSDSKLQKIKAESEAIDKRLETTKTLQAEFEEALPEIKDLGILGAAEHVASLVKQEQEKEGKLAVEKEKVDKKMTREESIKTAYEQRRNDIAEKFINRDAEKLQPIEADIAEHQLHKKTLEESIASTKEDRKKYETIVGKRTVFLKDWSDRLRRSGKTEKEISQDLVVVGVEQQLAQAKKALEEKEEMQSKRLLEINQRIAKAQAKAEPYRRKIKEFTAITERGKKKEENEITNSNISTNEGNQRIAHGSSNYESATGTSGSSPESMFQDEYNQPVQAFVAEWNDFLRKEHGIVEGKDKIDLDKFIEATSWSKRAIISEESFVKVLKSYYQQRFKGEAYPDKVAESVAKFLEQRHQE